MKLKEDSSVQKLRGAYYTPLPLAEMMVKLFANKTDCKNVLEPSCGDGVFLDALIKADCIKQYADIDAVEIDRAEAKKVKERMKAYKNVKVINEDFFDFYRANKESVQYDLILGNPPYIRY